MAAWPYSTERWQRLRATKLEADPYCELCPRSIGQRLATCVDHRQPIRHHGDARAWDWFNLASACWPCHSAKTARGVEAGGVRTTKPMKGCGLDGAPLDPSHPFFK